MKRKDRLPLGKVFLESTSPLVQQTVINLFKAHDIAVYEETTGYDSEYPYLCWSGDKLGQTMAPDNPVSFEKFLEMFFNSDLTSFKLNELYSADIIYKDKLVKVGCQEFTFDKINQLHELINKKY